MFAPWVSSKVLLAVFDALVRDDVVRAHFTGGIFAADAEDTFLEGSVAAPALCVIPTGIQRTAVTGGSHAVETAVTLFLVEAKRDHVLLEAPLDVAAWDATLASSPQPFERLDLLGHLWRVLYGAEAGVLRNPLDTEKLLTEALVRFQQVGEPLQLPGKQEATRVVALYQSDVGEDLEFLS